MSGPGALCVGPRRSLCWAPALTVCWRPGALCVGFRRFLCRGSVSRCRAPAVSVSAPPLSASGPGALAALSASGPGALYVGRRHSVSGPFCVELCRARRCVGARRSLRRALPLSRSLSGPATLGFRACSSDLHPFRAPPTQIRMSPSGLRAPSSIQPGAFPFSRREPQTFLFGRKLLVIVVIAALVLVMMIIVVLIAIIL